MAACNAQGNTASREFTSPGKFYEILPLVAQICERTRGNLPYSGVNLLPVPAYFKGSIPFQIPKFWSAIKDEISALLETVKS